MNENEAGTGFILKKKDETEAANYLALNCGRPVAKKLATPPGPQHYIPYSDDEDPMLKWTPRFGGITATPDGTEFIRLENLTSAE